MPLTRISTGDIGLVTENNYLSPSLSNWRVYNDGDTAVPLDGTGGTPLVTFVRDSSSPMNSTGDFRFTKSGSASRRGQGVSVDFNVEKRHLGKVLQLSLDYELVSGTLATGDLRVYVVQDPNGTPVLLEPVNVSIGTVTSGFGSSRHVATFQTHVSLQTYRLCVHVSTTSTSDYTVDFTNFRVSEPLTSVGAVITDWTPFTMQIKGATTDPTKATTRTEVAVWRRVGANLEIQYNYEHTNNTGASAGSGNYYWVLPNGLQIDTTKTINSTTNATVDTFGNAQVSTTSGDFSATVTKYVPRTDSLVIAAITSIGSYGTVNSGVNHLGLATVRYSFRASVPIAGWGSNLQLSSDSGDGRVVAARYTNATISSTVLVYQTLGYDTHNAYNNSTGVFTAPISGYYRYSLVLRPSFNAQVSAQVNESIVEVIVDGYNTGYTYNAISQVYLTAGQRLRFTCIGGSGLNSQLTNQSFSIERISAGSQVIATSEGVNLLYTTASNTHNSSGNSLDLIYGTRVKDSHGSYNTTTGVFTAPMSGVYSFFAQVLFNINSSGFRQLYLTNTSNTVIASGDFQSTIYYTSNFGMATIIVENYPMLAGDQVKIRYYQTSGVNLSLNSSHEYNRLSITRTGNY